jgi:two-component system, sensor histidine kinase and response regulator
MCPTREIERILLAEDNAVNRKLATLMLDKLGYRTDTANNGVEAVMAFDERRYDLILMDCFMPEMNGFEATREIRAREKIGQHTPIVALTANTQKGDREECLAAGMDDYLTKPVHENALVEILQRWLGRKPEEGVLDAEALDRLRELPSGDALIREVAALYVDDSALRLDAIRKAADRHDAAAIADAAHALKGGSANVGATQVQALAAKLEEMGRSGNLDGVGAVVEQLMRECDRAGQQLRAMTG